MRWVVALLVAPLLIVPSSGAAEAACVEPCGFIIPMIDLQFPDKELCGGGRLLYADESPDDCTPLMALGATHSIEGKFRMYWDAQEEPTYPINPDEPITVTFSETQSNADWIRVTIEPASFVITLQDLYDPDHYTEPDTGSNPIIWFNYERDITVTFERIGDPDKAWEEKMEDRQGVLPMFLKARSTASGAYYREAFGVEEFRFHDCGTSPEGCPDMPSEPATDDEENIPALPLALVGIGLLGLAARRRH